MVSMSNGKPHHRQSRGGIGGDPMHNNLFGLPIMTRYRIMAANGGLYV